MKIGHSYKSSYHFAVFHDTTFCSSISHPDIYMKPSFLCVDGPVTYKWQDKTYNGYKIIASDILGWILIRTRDDKDLDDRGYTDFTHSDQRAEVWDLSVPESQKMLGIIP